MRLVFDAQAWGGKDVGDNSQFWKPARILECFVDAHGDLVAEVLWEDGRVSGGHFVHCMRPFDAEMGA